MKICQTKMLARTQCNNKYCHICCLVVFLQCIKKQFMITYPNPKSMFQIPEIDESDKFYHSLPRLLQLIFALYNTMVSQSEMLCYFVIILNHMVSASLLTLFLPILIFLWAMLSVPRPTKRFWMTAIIYTEVRENI